VRAAGSERALDSGMVRELFGALAAAPAAVWEKGCAWR